MAARRGWRGSVCALLAGAMLLGSHTEVTAHEWLPLASAVADYVAVTEAPSQLVPVARPEIREREHTSTGRPAPLVPLYVSFVALQGLDLHSTHAALDRGHTEANPVMAPFVRNRGAALAFKAATTGATIFAVERLWKKNHRVAAVVTMVAANAAYALIVSHNYRTARR
ncbi:MAG TPA: DUF5658 family protein [Vicinamibacterales bacterium]